MQIRFPAAAALSLLAACASAAPSDPQDGGTAAGDFLAGRFAAGERDLPRAAEAFEAAARASGEPALAGSAFEYALAAGDIETAARYARRLMRGNAPPPSEGRNARIATFQVADLPRLTLAAVAIEDRDWSEALTLLRADYDSSLGQSLAFMLEGWVRYAKDGADAGTAFLSNPPDGVFAAFVPLHAALMYDLADRPGEARGAYATALQTPAAQEAAIAYALLQERDGERADAIGLYRRMSEQPGLTRRVGRMGLARLGAPLPGESDAFLRVAKRAPDRLVRGARDGAALVLADFARAAYDQASQERRAALRAGFGEVDLYLNGPLGFARLAAHLDPDQPTAQYLIGAISATYGQPAAAEAAYAEVPPASPYYAYAVTDRAEALVALDRQADAAGLLETYLEQDPLSPDVALFLSGIYAEEKRWDEAIAAGTRAVEAGRALAAEGEASSELWRYYFTRGATAVEAGRWAEGEADMRQALSLAPDESLVLNYLGYSYVERGERLNEAFAMIERALRLAPGSGAITDSLGWAHYQRGDYETAIGLLEDAVQLEPGDDTITDHLGDAYWQVGRKTEARYEWRRVLEIEGLDAALRSRVEAKLDGEAPAPGALADG